MSNFKCSKMDYIDLNISDKVTERYDSIEVDALASPNKLNYKANGLVLGIYALVILNDLRSVVSF